MICGHQTVVDFTLQGFCSQDAGDLHTHDATLDEDQLVDVLVSEDPTPITSVLVRTYGGQRSARGIGSVRHWQLFVDGNYVGDTSQTRLAVQWKKLARQFEEST